MTDARTRLRLRVVPFAMVAALSAYSFFAPGDDLPSDFDLWDKLGHASIFGALAITGAWAGVRLRRLGIGLFAYGAVVEILQATLPIQRDGDWHDVVADSIGIGAGLICVWAARRVVRRRWLSGS